MNVKYEIDDKEVKQFFANFNANLPQFKDSLLLGTSKVLVNVIKKQLSEQGMISSGELYNSTRYIKRGLGVYHVIMASYAYAVDLGSRKHTIPSSSTRARIWCNKKGIDFWGFWYNIKTKGTTKHPFLFSAFMASQPMIKSDIERRTHIFMKSGARHIAN